MYPLALLNTTIITADGDYTVRTVTVDEARLLCKDALSTYGFKSYVGHDAAAQILTMMFEVPVPVSRELFVHEPGQRALAFKLLGRLRVGRELTMAEVEAMGYTFKVIDRTS